MGFTNTCTNLIRPKETFTRLIFTRFSIRFFPVIPNSLFHLYQALKLLLTSEEKQLTSRQKTSAASFLLRLCSIQYLLTGFLPCFSQFLGLSNNYVVLPIFMIIISKLKKKNWYFLRVTLTWFSFRFFIRFLSGFYLVSPFALIVQFLISSH